MVSLSYLPWQKTSYTNVRLIPHILQHQDPPLARVGMRENVTPILQRPR